MIVTFTDSNGDYDFATIEMDVIPRVNEMVQIRVLGKGSTYLVEAISWRVNRDTRKSGVFVFLKMTHSEAELFAKIRQLA